MSNVRRRRSLNTLRWSGSECKCIWRLRRKVDDSPFTVSALCARTTALLQTNTIWNATAIAHWWPQCACRVQERCGLPVPPAGGQRISRCAWRAAKVEHVASRRRCTQAHFAHEHKRISSRLTEGSWKPENTAVCVLASIGSQARPKYATAADA